MSLGAEDIAQALGRIEAKLDLHIEHSREWRAHADLAAKSGGDPLRHGGIGMVAGVALAAGALGSEAMARLKSVLGLG